MTVQALAAYLFRRGRRHFWLAALLAALVPLTGLVLMGVSGWFVAASAAAGLAGAGLVFDFFRPSAIIRLTSPGRAAARYGDRVVGHDTTLRALNHLRRGVFRSLSAQPLPQLLHLRAAATLNRLTADMDAAEGVLIRLVFPLIATVLAVVVGAVAIWLLISATAALAVLAVYGSAILLMLWISGARLAFAAQQQETALQNLRSGTAAVFSLRQDYAVLGNLDKLEQQVLAQSVELESARAFLDKAEQFATALLTIAPAALVAFLMWENSGGPAPLLGAILIALALAEAPRTLWRGLAERGRMALAAQRIVIAADDAVIRPTATSPLGPYPIVLQLTAVQMAALEGDKPLFAPVTCSLTAGQWMGIAAASGAGKSSLLFAIAGLAQPLSGQINLAGHSIATINEAALRDWLTLVPQRPNLVAGTIAENLRLAQPDASDETLIAALRAVQLWDTLAPRGGLGFVLAGQGAGLSGGEMRRVALARAILRRPALLLLDEPTEGLDAVTAAKVLRGIKAALPDAAVVIVSHRAEDFSDHSLIDPQHLLTLARSLQPFT